MAKPKKVCRKCRLIVKGNHCPLCNGTDFTTVWSGTALILDPKNCQIANAMGIEVKGRYALRVR